VVLVLGLYFIWSAQIPSLRFLERVQLLPSIEFLAAGPAGETKPPIEAATSPKVDSIEAALKPDSSMQSKVEQAMPGYSLTLAGLLGAIGILLFLIVLAKYLPSLLDFAILSRFKIAGGDRKAITTVVSYIFVIIGLSAAASKMGLRWSQVQWLAAAFSFGLGFGLQDIFANFFSGLVLLFERPMRVGDFCRFGDQLGTVESIGLRSTKVRGLDRTIINVPNADFSKKELINYAKRDRFLLRTTIGLRYETTDEQLRYVLAKLRELLLSHPKMLEEQARVRFVGYGEYSLDIEIFAYALARDWAEFLGIREDVFLRIKLIVEESGSGFAFPSQTHYLSRDQGLDAERTAAAEAQVQTWRSENRLPFPDFSEKQRRLFRDSLDYPPAGSPYAGLHAGPTGNKKARDDRK
jgi:MscS family membrane protein